MAHIYMSFDFGTDEEKAQQARHKLEMWKQAFRLDKKLLYKFERPGGGMVTDSSSGNEEEKPLDEAEGQQKPAATKGKGAASAKSAKASAKGGKAAKGKSKAEPQAEAKKPAVVSGPVRLHLRLGFSAHEKMTEDRLVKRIPGEEPFKDASPEVMRQGEPGFDETAAVFDALD
jgi:hypothetical protein